MRAILAAILLLAPFALAQPLPAAVVVTVDAPPAIAPLQGIESATFHVDVSCAQLTANATPPEVHVWIAKAPTWAKAAVSPSTFAVDPTKCSGGRASLAGQLLVGADATAPAWTPSAIVVAAALEGLAGNLTGSGSTNVTARFFGILDVSVREAVAEVPPGITHDFGMMITNRGNDGTLVKFTLQNATEGFVTTLPDPILLVPGEPRFVQVMVRAPGGSLTNKVGAIDVRIESEDAREQHAPGDSSNVSFVLTSKSRGVPAPPTGGTLLALTALALAVRLRSPRCSRAS